MSSLKLLHKLEYPEATTELSQYSVLDIDKEIKSVNICLKENNLYKKHVRNKYFVDYNEHYKLDIILYKKLLRVFKTTKLENILWRVCLIRGIFEFIHPNGRYVINLK